MSSSYRTEKLKTMVRDHLPVLSRWRAALHHVPDARLYAPTFQPWRGMAHFRALYDEIAPRTLIQPEAAWVLHSVARQAAAVPGDFLEVGVFRGGSARLLRRVVDMGPAPRRLHLFDTFAGAPQTAPPRDGATNGDGASDGTTIDEYADTGIEAVSSFIGGEEWIRYHTGLVPDTFRGLEDLRLAFAHIDVDANADANAHPGSDAYHTILDVCAFVYPRLSTGGCMLFADYGLASCPGARAAVDEFFAGKPEVPLILHTGQAVIHRTTAAAAGATTATTGTPPVRWA